MENCGMDKETERVINETLAAADEITGKVHVVCVDGEDHSDYRLRVIYGFLFAKSVRTFKAFAVLVKNGYTKEAEVLTRVNFESLVDWLYLAKDSVRRSEMYEDYLNVWRERQLRVMDDTNRVTGSVYAPVPEELRSELTTLKSEFVKKYGLKQLPDSWSGKDLRNRAEEVGYLEAYLRLYKPQSDLIHSGPGSTNYYLDVSDDQVVGLRTMPEWQDLGLVTSLGCAMMLDCLGNANEAFALRCDDVMDKLSRLALDLQTVGAQPES